MEDQLWISPEGAPVAPRPLGAGLPGAGIPLTLAALRPIRAEDLVLFGE